MNYGGNQFAPGYTNAGFNYTTDEEFKYVIVTYANILKQYGLDFLKTMEEPTRIDYFREEDQYKLFNEHESMAQSFSARFYKKREPISNGYPMMHSQGLLNIFRGNVCPN